MSDKTKKPKKERFRRTKRMFLVSSIKQQHQFIANVFNKVFKVRKPKSEMRYEDLANIGVDDAKRALLIKRFTFFVRLYLVGALIVYFYMLYLFIEGHGLVGLVALSVLLIVLAHAFKYHFWRYQLLKKKLGCTFQEWLRDLFKGVK